LRSVYSEIDARPWTAGHWDHDYLIQKRCHSSVEGTAAMTRAQQLAQALGGRKAGADYVARCPAHNDRKPSLSISDANDGKVLVYCHAGCDQEQVITALRRRGLWRDDCHRLLSGMAPSAAVKSQPDANDAWRTRLAFAIWQFAKSPHGTLVETYLASRGIRLPLPTALRFHPGLKHPSGGIWPAMVALVTRGPDSKPIGIHRTYLARDGSGKAPLAPAKMMLGPCRGGVVRLGPVRDLVMVGEGIETCFAAMHATGHPAWAALSTSGLRTLDLPPDACDIIVLADGDDPGEAAARDAALRWCYEGRRVRVARPPQALDFNDVLLSPTSLMVEDCHVG
jgi:putative DNA primase/helicase